MKKTTIDRRQLGLFYTLLFACSSLFLSPAFGQEDEEVYELSPFTIESDDSVGYLANSTLAGTRLKSSLKDIGSAISVVTPEFLEDTGATDAASLLVYTVGTEIGGFLGNFAGPGVAAGDESANSTARGTPHANNRVRGLSSAATTRDYFLTGFGFDGYNTETVTISRGPNSILFGIGEPGGIIENSLKQAKFGTDISRISVRFGEHNSHRQTVDFNRELIEDRVAVRLNIMNEDIKFQQKPSYEEDMRFTVSTSMNLFLNEDVDWLEPTVLRASFETAEIRSSPPNVTPPQDTYSHWWEPTGSPAADAMVGRVLPTPTYREDYASQWVIDALGGKLDPPNSLTTPGEKHAGQPELWNSYAVVYANPNGVPGVGGGNGIEVIDGTGGAFELQHMGQTITAPGWFPMYSTNIRPWDPYPGFKRLTIQNSEVFDWENVQLAGRMQYANHDFDAINIVLEQNFWENKAGIQYAYDKQTWDRETHFPLGNHHYAAVRIDTGLYMTDGTPNPNVGRPLISGQIVPRQFRYDERETHRMTAYYNLDFTDNDGWSKYLGDHVFNALFNTWENDIKTVDRRMTWDDSHDPDQNFRGNINRINAWGGRMFFLAYVGDAQWDAKSPDQMRLYNEPLKIEVPKPGEEFRNYYFDRESNTINYSTIKTQEVIANLDRSRQEIDSEAFTLQSKFLDDLIVATFGWREDTAKTFEVDQNPFKNSDTNAYDNLDAWEEGWISDSGSRPSPVLDQTGQTRTTQVVAHVPDEWMEWGGDAISSLSFHWAESENFNPASVRRDVTGAVIGNPSGETEDYGVSIGFAEDRAYLRMTWYETSSKNITNSNFQGRMWAIQWPISMAQRWMNAKNTFEQGGDDALSFDDIAWRGPEGTGPDLPGAEYDPSRIGDGRYNSFDEVIQAFLNTVPSNSGYVITRTGAPGDELIEFQAPQGMSTVADSISEGFEAEMIFNVTDSWRIAFNASETESTFGNGLKVVGPYIEEITQNFMEAGLWTMAQTPNEGGTVEGRWTNETLVHFNGAKAKEGTVNSELRKWRWNFITNYEFQEGTFEGFGVGGAIRWQDSVSTGYPLIRDSVGTLLPDLANPWTGGTRWDGDLWLNYHTEIMDTPVKFQLNLQNYFGDRDPIPVAHNPDGVLAIVRSAPEKRWFLTTTIDF